LILVRPLSGSGSLAAYADLLERYGADSFVGLCASVIVASSDTLIYVAAVYFSAAKVKKTRYTLPAGLAVSLFSVLLSCALCRLFYE
jgi:spore maturation protein B